MWTNRATAWHMPGLAGSDSYGESLHNRFTTASKGLVRLLLGIYLASLFVELVVEAVYLWTGDKTWTIFIVDMIIFNVAAALLATVAFVTTTKQWKRNFETQNVLVSIADISSDAVYSMDGNAVINAWSKGAERIFGYSTAEAIGSTADIILTDDFFDREAEALATLVNEGVVINNRALHKRKDGTVFSAETSAMLLRDHKGQPRGILEITRDITEQLKLEGELIHARDDLERRIEERTSELRDANTRLGLEMSERERTQQALAKSEEHFRSLIENSQDIIMVVNRDLELRFLSPSIQAVLGYRPCEVIGRNVFEFIHQDDAERIAGEFSYGIENPGIKLSAECRVLRSDGEWCHFESVGTNLLEDPVVAGIVLNSRDVTERKLAADRIQSLNQSLNQTVNSLQNLNQELEAFSYSVSHDLRAPLRAISGFADMISQKCSDEMGDEGRRLLEVILRNTEYMDQLIDDLLDFSRTSQQEMRFHTVDMEALAHQVWKDLEEFRSGREIEFVVGELPGIQGDRSMLQQVFVNLIGNAIKFTGKTNSAKIEAGGSIENGSAVYYLADNGAGFNMEYADKLFGVFQRLHSKEEFEGTGVGLALVQRIIHRHGGEIWAKGKPGLGATFYFSLPYAADAGMVEDRGPDAYTPAGSANTGSG